MQIIDLDLQKLLQFFQKSKEEAVSKPRGSNITHIDPLGMNYVAIPAGNYKLGATDFNDNPERTVELSGYQMSATVVTQEMYQKVMGTNPSHFVPSKGEIKEAGITDTSKHPVEKVSWADAVNYCKELSLKASDVSQSVKRLIEGMDAQAYNKYALENRGLGLYRLPTEAEWEASAREEVESKDGVISADNSGSRTHSVEELVGNARGLKMRGNVWQWCADSWSATPVEGKDPVNLETSGTCVVRGGSWFYNFEDNFRSAFRYHYCAVIRYDLIGFRLVRT